MTGAQYALLGTAGVLVVALIGVWQLIQAHLDRLDLARRSELARVEYQASLLRYRADAWLRRNRLGHRLGQEVSRAGVALSALDLLVLYVGAAMAGFLVVAWLAPAWLGVGGAAAGVWGVRQWLDSRRQARLEEFVAQLPEFARTLSNATSAGRSLLSALQLAAQDMDDPAGAELALVSEQLRIGQSVDDALESLKKRLPSRELAVLVSTLVIQQRTGGDVVRALRDMADTLEARKDLRREVTTIVSGAVQTGYVTGGLGILIVLAANAMQGGMIDQMVRSTPGQLALLVSISLYVVAFAAVRRMTNIDV